jgi:hypothetical protein
MRCPYCGKEITEEEKKTHGCFLRRDAERDVKPMKWKPDVRK